ncbi:MAG: DUF2269 family protein [Actinomycetota bacterium]
MDGYDIVKFIHILAAVIWVGAGLMLTIISLRAGRSTDPTEIVKLGRDAGWLGTRFFVPASLTTLIFGIITVLVGEWSFGDAWIIIGLAGFAISFIIGAGFLGPQSEKIGELADEHGETHPLVVQHVKKVLGVTRVDQLIILAVVLDMVVKPGT